MIFHDPEWTLSILHVQYSVDSVVFSMLARVHNPGVVYGLRLAASSNIQASNIHKLREWTGEWRSWSEKIDCHHQVQDSSKGTSLEAQRCSAALASSYTRFSERPSAPRMSFRLRELTVT